MPATKLRLKRTAAEQAEHDLRKARKAARRTASSRRPRAATSDDEEDYGPMPAEAGPSNPRHSPEGEDVFRRVEEERFREKMAEAAMDDDYTSGVHARFESYGHAGRIPRRWEAEWDAEADPAMMEEEEYAEWVRAGIWRRKNAAAQEEERRRRAAREAAEAEARRALDREKQARARRKRERALRRKDEARLAYEARWAALLIPPPHPDAMIKFEDVPWPVFEGREVGAEEIETFLLQEGVERKEVLRRTMLRFHPDKFEGRIMGRVAVEDRERVRETVGAVVRAVGVLMAR